MLSATQISKYIEKKSIDFDIEVIKETASTNAAVKKLAQSKEEGYTLVALSQTQGKGRLGRRFYSPEETGIYMSLLLKPRMSANESLSITTMAAVAVVKAIKTIKSCEPRIKWVNDIYVENKKICGILTEAKFGQLSECLDYAILGIGINICTPKEGFPEDIADIATAIYDLNKDNISEVKLEEMKAMLVAHILQYFSEYYTADNKASYMDKYREYSYLTGKKITYEKENAVYTAKVIDIDDDAGLVVENSDGSIRTLNSGEIQILKK